MKSKPSSIEGDTFVDRRHQPAERLVVLLCGFDDGLDRVGEVFVFELTRDTERARQIEMPDPETIDPIQSGHALGVLDPFACLDLGEQGGSAIGLGELVEGRPRQVAIMGDRQGDAALTRGHVLHAIEDLRRLPLASRPWAA